MEITIFPAPFVMSANRYIAIHRPTWFMANAANLKKEIVLLANDKSISSNSNIFSTAEEFVFSFLLVTI